MAIIRGQVFDPAGRPVAEAAVYVVAAPVDMPDIALLTDGEGRFALGVPAPGVYTLGVRSDAFGQTQREVEVGGEDSVTAEERFALTGEEE